MNKRLPATLEFSSGSYVQLAFGVGLVGLLFGIGSLSMSFIEPASTSINAARFLAAAFLLAGGFLVQFARHNTGTLKLNEQRLTIQKTFALKTETIEAGFNEIAMLVESPLSQTITIYLTNGRTVSIPWNIVASSDGLQPTWSDSIMYADYLCFKNVLSERACKPVET